VRALVHFDTSDVARTAAVRPHAAIAAELDGVERAVVVYAYLVILLGGPAAVHGDEVFLAREFQLDGRAGALGKHGGHQVEIVILVLVAKAAAHELAHHAHFFGGQLQIARDVGMAV
jgi:hypothetical protein